MNPERKRQDIALSVGLQKAIKAAVTAYLTALLDGDGEVEGDPDFAVLTALAASMAEWMAVRDEDTRRRMLGFFERSLAPSMRRFLDENPPPPEAT